MITGRTVVDFAGVHMGVADDGQFYDYAGVHAGTVTPAGDVVDFAGVRIGCVLGAAESAPAMAGAS